jgi:hypothetical protein
MHRKTEKERQQVADGRGEGKVGGLGVESYAREKA